MISIRILIALSCLTMFVSKVLPDDCAMFESSELQCIIGNNAAMNDHKAGYNGVFSLTSIHQKQNVFVPAYAGLNLEHVFHANMNLQDRQEFFEPRNSPMEFKKIDNRTAQLYQPPTPYTSLESITTFKLVDPNYIDIEFSCTPTKNIFDDHSFGLFWASYINGPEDKSIYFLRESASNPSLWQQFCTQMHNRDSTVRRAGEPFRFAFPESFINQTLFTSFSNVEYQEPFFYGRFHNMVLIYMFDSSSFIRFAHSPSGGGTSISGDDTNPAWDFQMIIPNAITGQSYKMQMRAVYKQWIDRADVLREFQKYKTSLR